MEILERLHELGIGLEKIVDLPEIAALHEGAQPLRIRHDEVVFLSPEVSEAFTRV
jgi:hypothetical protein